MRDAYVDDGAGVRQLRRAEAAHPGGGDGWYDAVVAALEAVVATWSEQAQHDAADHCPDQQQRGE